MNQGSTWSTLGYGAPGMTCMHRSLWFSPGGPFTSTPHLKAPFPTLHVVSYILCLSV